MVISNKVHKTVCDHLEIDVDYNIRYDYNLYVFYHKCMKRGMHYADADRYAILNTLIGYDIGAEAASIIDSWMYEHDEEIYELTSCEKDKQLVMTAAAEHNLNIDFTNWLKEDYEEYKFFNQEEEYDFCI